MNDMSKPGPLVIIASLILFPFIALFYIFMSISDKIEEFLEIRRLENFLGRKLNDMEKLSVHLDRIIK